MSNRPIPPDDVDRLVALAQRFGGRGSLEAAADLYLLALRLDPKNVGVKLGLAEVRKLQRQSRAACRRGGCERW